MDLPATSRRRLLGSSGLLALGALLPARLVAQSELEGLTRITADVVPISAEERAGRLARARALMDEGAIDAVLIEPGASLAYFTGIKWRRSERLTAAVLFRDGQILVVTPFFEEPSVRETLAVPAEVRVWQEDEDPIALIADVLRQRRLHGSRLAVEETVRFFVSQGLATRLPTLKIVSADPVVRGCRMIKSPAEIALMRKAADVTMAAYRWLWPRIRPGMTPGTIGALMNAATVRLGGVPQFAMALLGEITMCVIIRSVHDLTPQHGLPPQVRTIDSLHAEALRLAALIRKTWENLPWYQRYWRSIRRGATGFFSRTRGDRKTT